MLRNTIISPSFVKTLLQISWNVHSSKGSVYELYCCLSMLSVSLHTLARPNYCMQNAGIYDIGTSLTSEVRNIE